MRRWQDWTGTGIEHLVLSSPQSAAAMFLIENVSPGTSSSATAALDGIANASGTSSSARGRCPT
jgi:hypothetical protein